MEQKHTEARTRGRCCDTGWENIRDTWRRETVDMFAKRWGSLFLPACMWTLDLLDFFVWQRAEPALFAGPGDGCLPLRFCAHVFLGARLWEQDNKIRAPVGHSSRKLTSGSNVGEVTHSHRSAKKTARTTSQVVGRGFIRLLHLMGNFISGVLAPLPHFGKSGLVWLDACESEKEYSR